ncbi:MAG: (d)CMP kinase [Bacteroidales bacterium]|nr:(d)CMP kinase [Bacteroidales bacterium]
MYKLTRKIIVAVDGFSSCGKSSFAKLIAEALDYLYLDSGAMYRAVALFTIRNNMVKDESIDTDKLVKKLSGISINFKKEHKQLITLLNDMNVEKEIRGATVAGIVSQVSKIPEVRGFLVEKQREMGINKGIVMDGRDIGTVVFPNADVKIFMKADVSVRAKRRYDELIEKGIEANFQEIKANIEERDFLDLNREISPLRQAPDAYVLDNSTMTFDDQMEWFEDILKEKLLLV